MRDGTREAAGSNRGRRRVLRAHRACTSARHNPHTESEMSVSQPGRDVPHTGEAGHARSWLWPYRLGLATGCLLLGAAPVSAQIPAIPVLQNAWMNNGVTVAANGGSSDMGTGYAAALAWAPSSRRLQISLGAGLFSPDSGD